MREIFFVFLNEHLSRRSMSFEAVNSIEKAAYSQVWERLNQKKPIFTHLIPIC